MKYTYADIIIDPNDPRLEGAIGKDCYYSYSPSHVLQLANFEIGEAPLVSIDKTRSEDQFAIGLEENPYYYDCIILKKEEEKVKPSYIKLELGQILEPSLNPNDYKPFDLSKKEVRDNLRGQWIVKKDDRYTEEYMIIGFGFRNDEPIVYVKDSYLYNEQLWEKYTFLDGTPCGELITKEEA